MHPAASVIVFTTLSGLGFGLMIMLGLGFGPSDPVVGPLAGLAALGMAGVGLMASTFHLGNPQRFLKALTQWRSSWLSREGCVSVVLMTLFFAYVVLWWWNGAPNAFLGLWSAILAALAVFCTAMIYAQLKTVPRWSTPWTVPMFLGYALAGGLICVMLARAVAGDATPVAYTFALLIASAAMYMYRRMAMAVTLASAGSSPETATGLGHLGTVRLLEPPHSSPNYLMKEMVHKIGRKHAEKLALISVILGIFVPLFLVIVAREPSAFQIFALLTALVLHYGGALASRWLFFAEAEHVVGLYYGQR